MQDRELYGLMESLKGLGSIPVLSLKTQQHGSRLDLGDIEVEPGYRLYSGRCWSSPTGKRVHARDELLGIKPRGRSGTLRRPPVGPDGWLSASGLPAERVSLSTTVRGYRPSPRNASFDLLNRLGLLGMIKGDVEDLRFLLDPGPDPDHHRLSEDERAEYDRRRNSTLSGVSDGRTP